MRDPWENERIWRWAANFWTVAVMAAALLNFFGANRYDFLMGSLAVLYTGVLTIYVGTKEFDRWYAEHAGRHPGEWFVILWTALLFFLFVAGAVGGEHYRVSADVVAVYIAVLSLFALTQKSKQLYRRRKKK